jgi:RNA polymerase primary sigma factor
MARRNAEDTAEIRRYLDEVRAVALLTPVEEDELAALIRAGHDAAERLGAGDVRDATERRALQHAVAAGDDARDRFVRANLRLVIWVARRYRGAGLSLGDLVQEGNLGLLRAIETFDHRKGFTFSTYATW